MTKSFGSFLASGRPPSPVIHPSEHIATFNFCSAKDLRHDIKIVERAVLGLWITPATEWEVACTYFRFIAYDLVKLFSWIHGTAARPRAEEEERR